MNDSKREITQQSIPNLLQSIIAGSIAGGIEVLMDHPWVSIKNRMQNSEVFTLKPNILYRGLAINALGMIPITAMQVSLNSGFKKLMLNQHVQISQAHNFGIGFAAGFCSALVGAPLEMIMINQQSYGGNLYAASRRVVAQGGVSYLYTGLLATGLRDGFFAAFYLAVAPYLTTKLRPYCANDHWASFFGGITAGVGATLASQAADTTKTIQQKTPFNTRAHFIPTVKKIYSEQGGSAFFRGTVPRGIRVAMAVTIIGCVQEKVSQELMSRNIAG